MICQIILTKFVIFLFSKFAIFVNCGKFNIINSGKALLSEKSKEVIKIFRFTFLYNQNSFQKL